MIIKTITCHDVYNYGASLQAYALQHFLSNKGNDVEIIDYLPKYMDKAYRFIWKNYAIPEMSKYYKYHNNILIQLVYHLKGFFKQAIIMITTHGRKKSFDKFTRNKLVCTSKHYKTLEELQNADIKADCFIAGSDQIWNPKFGNGFDGAYFLNFGKGKKYSYAGSFGVSTLNDQEKLFMAPLLQNIDGVSVREKTAIRLSAELGVKDAIQVCDPVYLLSKDEWNDLASSKYNFNDYILVYNLSPFNKEIARCAQYLAKSTKKKIVAIEERTPVKYADIRIKNAGPQEFVELISKASYVVTNSFHATSFSLIYNVPFFTFNKNANCSRVADVLADVGASNRLNSDSFDKNINWEEVNSRLSGIIKNSIKYLSGIYGFN